MPNIYESKNMYFMQDNNGFVLCDIMIKRNTIVIMPTDIYFPKLENYKVYTYKELKNELLKKDKIEEIK